MVGGRLVDVDNDGDKQQQDSLRLWATLGYIYPLCTRTFPFLTLYGAGSSPPNRNITLYVLKPKFPTGMS